MDPMHDNQLDSLSGFPDVESSASIVRCIKKSYTIKYPSSPALGYDVVVYTLPFLGLSKKPFQLLDTRGNSLYTFGAGGSIQFGHILIAYFNVGTLSYDINNAIKIDVLDVDASYLEESMRVVGSGIEINNTTAEIYKQGTATVARIPQRAPEPIAYRAITQWPAVGTPQTVPVSGYLTETMPKSLADVMLIAGTRQWEAKDGAYVVEAFCGQDNPPRYPEFSTPIVPNIEYVAGIFPGGSASAHEVFAISPYVHGPPPMPGWDFFDTSIIALPMHSSCVMLTGLSPESTFNLQWNCYLESFPDYGDPSISVLAKPSCVYDSLALHILSECLNTLPVGVQASENPFGEWFTRIISEVADFAAPMLTPVLGPEASVGALALGKAAKAWHDANYPPRQKKQVGSGRKGAGFVAGPGGGLKAPPQQKQAAKKRAAAAPSPKRNKPNPRKKGKKVVLSPAEEMLLTKIRSRLK